MRRTIAAFAAAAAMAAGGFMVPASAVGTGDDGCTPGFWKNHTDVWEEFEPENSLVSVFPQFAEFDSTDDLTLLQALDGGGGPGQEGAALILARATVAALLNATHNADPTIGWEGSPLNRRQIQNLVTTAVDADTRAALINLAASLDDLNNSTCPLS